VQGGQGFEAGPAKISQGQSLAAVVRRVGEASDQAGFFGPVDEFYRRVVPEFHPVRDFSDGRGLIGVSPPDGQQELMLGRGEPGCLRGLLRKV
jgi:hypothetical protein